MIIATSLVVILKKKKMITFQLSFYIKELNSIAVVETKLP